MAFFSTRPSAASVNLHVVFCTERLRKSIAPEIRDALLSQFNRIAAVEGVKIIESAAMPDHVHLFLVVKRHQIVADVIRVLKSNSMRWIHDSYTSMQSFSWQVGFTSLVVKDDGVTTVKKYIQDQEEHHSDGMSYADEVRMLADNHGMKFDAQQFLG